MSETITIEGNFTIKGVGGLKSVKQPLKYLELEIAFPPTIKPVRVQASKNPVVEEELKVGDNVHIKQSDFGTLIIKKLGDIWVECEAGGLIRILVKREDLAKEVNNKSDFMQASGGIKEGTLKPIEPKIKFHITNCKKCGKQYIVGINGKDIRTSETSGGKIGDIPFMAIGNDEIEKAKPLPVLVDCKNCGNICRISVIGEPQEKPSFEEVMLKEMEKKESDYETKDAEMIKEVLEKHSSKIYTNGNPEGQKEILNAVKSEKLINFWESGQVTEMLKEAISLTRKKYETKLLDLEKRILAWEKFHEQDREIIRILEKNRDELKTQIEEVL